MLLLIDHATNLLCISPSAKKALELKEVFDFDSIKSMRTQSIIEEDFRLTLEKQTAGIKKLAKKVLKGEKEFEVDIKGKSYTVLVEKIPEVKFYLIGLLESK